MTTDRLATALADIAGALPAGHVSAWAAVLGRSTRPSSLVEARLIDASPGFAAGARAARLIAAWRREAPDLPGPALAVALQSAARVHEKSAQQSTSVVVSGPTTDAVPVRLTSAVAVEIVHGAIHSLLVVSFAAYGVAEVVAALDQAADRGVSIDLVLESTAEEGGTLHGPSGAAAFDALRGKAQFWYWPAHNRPGVGASRAALHAKLIVADRRVALLGSANLTDKALANNLEVGVILRDPDVVRQITRHFAALMDAGAGALEPLP